jgi:addiction module HigA family antidote
MKNSPDPGDFIRTEIIEPAGLSVTAAAMALQVSRRALSSPLNGNADLSGDMALRIEKTFGAKMDTRMRRQATYDIAQTQKREKEIHVSAARRYSSITLLCFVREEGGTPPFPRSSAHTASSAPIPSGAVPSPQRHSLFFLITGRAPYRCSTKRSGFSLTENMGFLDSRPVGFAFELGKAAVLLILPQADETDRKCEHWRRLALHNGDPSIRHRH